MPRNTPLYGLPALASGDRLRDIADIDWANALKLEQILQDHGQPPLDSDLVSLLKRVAALEPVVGAVTAWNTSWNVDGSYVQKVGRLVTLVWQITGPTVAANTAANVANLPAAFAPSRLFLGTGSAYTVSAPYASTVQVSTGGTLTVFTTTAGPQSSFAGSASWLAAA